MEEQIYPLEVVENVKDNIESNIYNTIIPRSVRLAEAPSHGVPITSYDPKSSWSRKLSKTGARSNKSRRTITMAVKKVD